ncbi:MAG: DUF2950 domain-containing protein [Solirubrobacterales bacterium]
MLQLLHRWKKTCMSGRTLWVIPVVPAILITLTWTSFAQETQQQVFASPQAAMQALVSALRAGDKQSLLAILGPASEEILSSGDPVADKADRDRFLAAYDDKVDLAPKGNDQVEVILGHENWPFPIPMVKANQGWLFDTEAGKEEILNRRIGRDELDAIQVCEGYVEAQKEYADVDRELDGIIQYAQKIISDPDTRNGLYWEPAEGEAPSPAGPFMARAAAEGYKKGEKPIPFHGYYYRILKAQGPNAPGGAYDYVINGHMVAGFALVAWPADYGVSGIMTFLVNRNAMVYEKDLGPNTAQIAEAMTQYNPDETWKRSQ